MIERAKMLDHVFTLIQSVVASFLHAWPYLLLTIPLAVIVQMSGASRYIKRAFQGRPMVAILLATAVGAFSPFCSCGVIPVIAALLIGGVPLAPVMSFWIASPSMDPEAFFLSVAMLGWELAVWRMGITLVLSLSAGLVTHLLQQWGWLGQQTLRSWSKKPAQDVGARLKESWHRLKSGLAMLPSVQLAASGSAPSLETACCSATAAGTVEKRPPVPATASSCSSSCDEPACDNDRVEPTGFRQRLIEETWRATLMVVKFMTLAFVIDALIKLTIPQEWVGGLLGQHNPWAILTAALLGVPAYASTLTALPMIGSLLAQGMNPAAALAFLVSGPITTLPAMAAVRGLTTRRVFALYVAFALGGAVVSGYVYSLAMSLF